MIKPDKGNVRNGNYRLIFFTNIHTKVLNKILEVKSSNTKTEA